MVQSVGSAPSRDIVAALQAEGYPVAMHCRLRSQGRGLSSAVLLGFRKAK